MKADALLALEKVAKKYGKRTILTDISLSIKHGECIIIRGSNGSGKSTLLRMVTGLIPLSTGQRILKDSNVVIGYTPDRLPKLRMTSTEYLTHMGKLSGMPKRELLERIKVLHSFFNLEQSSTLMMTHFSKGMLQKVNVMQATIQTPDVLVLDEPFSGLDKESIEHLLASLITIKAEGTAIIAAVHDPLLASQLESQTYLIQQGRLIEDKMEQTQGPLVSFFELKCDLSQEELHGVTSQFPDVTWKNDENGSFRFIIMKKDYSGFLLELIHKDIEIITLQRKEINV